MENLTALMHVQYFGRNGDDMPGNCKSPQRIHWVGRPLVFRRLTL